MLHPIAEKRLSLCRGEGYNRGMMDEQSRGTHKKTTSQDRWMADVCLRGCPVCKHARGKQRGLAFWWVGKVENHVCPFCRAYERVYGRKAHESPLSAPHGTLP